MSAQLQHYVPQFLLRRFGRGKTSQIHVFDKGAGKKFSGPANKLAAEREFYDFEFIGVPVTLEASLSQLESEAAQCVAALLKRRNLATENSEMLKERSIIIRFLAVQLVRTKGALAKQADISEQLRHIFSAAGMPEEFFKPPSQVATEQNALKANFATRICNAHKELGPALVNKNWLLFETTDDHAFLLGDHPVVLDNLWGGKLGLGVPGLVIYFPLSPTIALGLCCESIAQEIRKLLRNVARLPDQAFYADRQLYRAFEEVVITLEGFDKGLPVKLGPENVENMNSLQVIEAERFLFSADGDFSLAEDMLRTNPELKVGPRAVIKVAK